MNLQTSLAVFLLGVGVSLAPAQEGTPSGPASDEQPLVPVNQATRFLLSNTLPRLAESLTGSVEDRVILRTGEFQQENQSIVTQIPQARGKQEAWVQMNNYWIEPVTPPPSQGESTMVPIDDMRVVEVEGEVTLNEAAKSSKAKLIEVNEDMEVPQASTLSTADTGSVAVMVGGHTSIRLIPNSCAQFSYDVSGPIPRLAITLLRGAAFCKVGKLSTGRVPDVGVRGQAGSTANIGSSDFFVQTDPVSLHVCLVRGRLLVGEAIPLAVGNMDWYPSDAEATVKSGPQILHWPKPASAAKGAMDAQVLGFALHQADNLNIKIKALLSAATAPLSSEDQAYLAQVPKITWYAQATLSP